MDRGQALRTTIPEEDYMTSGHLACSGCSAPIAMRYCLKALEEKTILVVPACCWTIIAGPFPYSSLKVPLLHNAFEATAASASGVRAALDMQGDTETTVVGWAGDGGTFDIGIQALSGAVERNENILYICYDNEAYMNTGIQRSSATPWGAWTTTTPAKHPEDKPKKDIVEILVAHQIPYVATTTVAYPHDLMAKVKKAKGIKGTRFIHILSPCPPGWRMSDELTIKASRLAVQTGVFPLYEVERSQKYTITVPRKKDVPVKEYLQLQRRFAHLKPEDYNTIQENADRAYQKLLRKVQQSETL